MNEDENLELTHLLDRAVKNLFRLSPTLITRLAGLTVAPEAIRVEDPNLNLPELRADHVFIIPDSEAGPEGAIYLEYQLRPDPALLPSWATKWGGLMRQLGMPVVLLVLYLQKGDRATFPSQFRTRMGGIETELRFTTICLWEQTERIRSGELPELAPLLLLSEKNPTLETVREEKRLIKSANFPSEVEAELLGIAMLTATRSFARTLLDTIFSEDYTRMENTTVIGEWLQQSRAKGIAEGIAEGIAQGIAQGEARGIAQGEARGKTEEARKIVLRFLVKRFGTLPPALLKRVEQADADWCHTLLDKAMDAEALTELADLYANAPE